MNVIFLDIDGVLNSSQSNQFFLRTKGPQHALEWVNGKPTRAYRENEFCPIACSNLLYILERSEDTKIVVSSSWRKTRTIDELCDILAKVGIERDRIIGKTDNLYVARGLEIEKWIKDREAGVVEPLLYPASTPLKISNFVIIDDSTDMGPLMDHLVETDARHGLDWHGVQQAIAKLEHVPPGAVHRI